MKILHDIVHKDRGSQKIFRVNGPFFHAESDGAVRFGDFQGCDATDFIFASHHYKMSKSTNQRGISLSKKVDQGDCEMYNRFQPKVSKNLS